MPLDVGVQFLRNFKSLGLKKVFKEGSILCNFAYTKSRAIFDYSYDAYNLEVS